MKVFMLWYYYPDYLKYFYDKHPNNVNYSFKKHRQYILDDHFGWPADLADHMQRQGIDTEFVITNAEVLQKQWAKENHFHNYSGRNWEIEIALEQIKQFQPDWLLIPNPSNDTYKYIDGAKHNYRKLAFYTGHDISNESLIGRADMLLAINKSYVLDAYPDLKNVIDVGVGFSPAIAEQIGEVEKKYEVVFAGGISPAHKYRAEILAYLVENGIDLNIYGNIVDAGLISKIKSIMGDIIKRGDIKSALKKMMSIAVASSYEKHINAIKKVCHPPVYGMDYYHVLAASKVCLNIHIDLARNFSGNMRMFEATGVGACLFTDSKTTNSDLFEVNEEIKIFDSKEDLLHQVKNIKTKWDDIEEIAKAGQKRTLKDHSIAKMFDDIKVIFDED